MSGEPTVLICVGATKAGTSWLYDHLRVHPDCHLRSIKELHYFDMQHHRNFDRYLAGLTRRATALTAERAGAPARAFARLDRKLADVADWRAVVDLRADDVPDFLETVATALAQCAGMPFGAERPAVGIVVELDQARPPDDANGQVRGQADADGRAQALWPPLNRSQRGR